MLLISGVKRILLILIVLCLFCCSSTSEEYNNEDLNEIIIKAESGDAYYQGVLGSIYRKGEIVNRDFEKAYKWIKLSVQKNNPIGIYNLAAMYQYGQKVEADTLKARGLFIKAFPELKTLAQNGDAIAQYYLAILYYYGLGIDKDLQESSRWNLEAFKQGYPQAISFVSRSFSPDAKNKQNYEEIKTILENLADDGNDRAQYELGNYYVNIAGLGGNNFEEAVKCFKKAQKPNPLYIQKMKKHDFIIPGLLPPKFSLYVEEGSCGENCLWTICDAKGINVTQLELTFAGADTARGLHSDELFTVMDKYDIGYIDLTRSLNASDSVSTALRYKEYLYDTVINTVKKGNPVLIGIKVYPTDFPQWFVDHFVLVVGYNKKTDELIFNDFNKRKRLNADKLLNKKDGYSFLNKWNWGFAIEFTDF